jgi:hypothetical protein
VLGGEIAVVRDQLDTLLGELDRRRREALNVPLQLRRHAAGVSVTVLSLALTAAGSAWLMRWRRRRRERLLAQGIRLRRAVARMTEHPERVATEPTIPAKIATAALGALVTSLVRKLLEAVVARWLVSGARPAARPALPPDAGRASATRASATSGSAARRTGTRRT